MLPPAPPAHANRNPLTRQAYYRIYVKTISNLNTAAGRDVSNIQISLTALDRSFLTREPYCLRLMDLILDVVLRLITLTILLLILTKKLTNYGFGRVWRYRKPQVTTTTL